MIDADYLAQGLPDVLKRLRAWIIGAPPWDMALMLQALQIRVTASHEHVQIEGTIPALPQVEQTTEDFVTIEQTSA